MESTTTTPRSWLVEHGWRPLTTTRRLSLRAAFCIASPLVLGILLHQRVYAGAVALGALWGVGQDGIDRWRQRGPRLAQVAVAGGVGITVGAFFVRFWPGATGVFILTGLVALVAGVIEASMYSAPGMYLLLGVIVGAGLGFHGHYWQSGLAIALGALWVYGVAALTDWRGHRSDQRICLANAFRQLAARLARSSEKHLDAARRRTIAILDVAQDAVGTDALDTADDEEVALRQCLIVALQLGELTWYLTNRGVAADPALVKTLREAERHLRNGSALAAVACLRAITTPVTGEQIAVRNALTPPKREDLREGQSFRSTLTRLPLVDRFRFAVMLSVATVAGALLGFAIDGPRAYWLPMSVAFIFRPDLGPVVRRALSRTAGTLAGVGIAALVSLTGNQVWLLIVLVVLMAASVPWAQQRSHALTVMFFTPIVFVFVSLQGPDQTLFFPRIIDTGAAAAIVLVMDYVFWLHAPSLRPAQLVERARAETERYEAYDDLDEPTIRHLRRRRAIRLVTQARASLAQSRRESHALASVDDRLEHQLDALVQRIDAHTMALIQRSLDASS